LVRSAIAVGAADRGVDRICRRGTVDGKLAICLVI